MNSEKETVETPTRIESSTAGTLGTLGLGLLVALVVGSLLPCTGLEWSDG